MLHYSTTLPFSASSAATKNLLHEFSSASHFIWRMRCFFPLVEGSSQKTEALEKAHTLKQLVHRLLLHPLAKAYQQDVGRIHPDIWLISHTFEKVIGLKDVCEQRAIAKGRQPCTFQIPMPRETERHENHLLHRIKLKGQRQ